ncbi:Z1 domain-containing protein [Corynebacterium flavescens]|uniref:Z1 domain-containing protein n=1 Tax=Actinomycetes TaxID=1760 RepID=UPI000EE6E953|nr:endonuclease [Corynebacterium flavescens]
MKSIFQNLRKQFSKSLPKHNPKRNRTVFDYYEFFSDSDSELAPAELVDYLENGDDEDIQPLISFIIAAVESHMTDLEAQVSSAPENTELLDWVLEKLGLAPYAELVKKRMPKTDPVVIVEEDFRPWYSQERENENSEYWDDYVRVLSRNGWDAQSIDTVGAQAREVISRIEDPSAEHYLSARGLVVGYVQSGKTANFSAVTAKAIDAGYRMIVILAGTLDNLRNQTQRRLDKEIFGKEAVLDGRSEYSMDERQLKDESYFEGDPEWENEWDEPGGAFIKHLDQEHEPQLGSRGFPRIKRLTTSKKDYQGSSGVSNPIEVPITFSDKPIHHPDNLANIPCMVAVVKKNASVLNKLNSDLDRAARLNGAMKDLPILVIDDESDQASINTKDNRKRTEHEERERTAVNSEIVSLLQNCPRAQYVGYTATPFANVFTDPSDPEDLYPRQFVLMLNEPPAYRGAKWFHDRADFLDIPDSDVSVEESRSKAFIRNLIENDSDGSEEEFSETRTSELQEALDAFVLTGAIKKYRESKADGVKFKHHTMLVHEGVSTNSHEDARLRLEEIWQRRGYEFGQADADLKKLFDTDFKPVMDVDFYNEGHPVPESFDELIPFISEACEEMMADVLENNEGRSTPILQVDTQGEDSPSFEMGKVWKVLVGGAKLSRGYTVEGLTISYFRRRAGGADTLMQTGRWFGFRKGFQDLVRLYAPDSLVEMFEGAMHDEENFRANVKDYSQMGPDGKPLLTPMRLAPLVQQTLPQLKPTSRNKMFNAIVVKSACAPKLTEFGSIPERKERGALAENFEQVAMPLLKELRPEPQEMAYLRVEGIRANKPRVSTGTVTGYVGTMDSKRFLSAFRAMNWVSGIAYEANFVAPRIKYLDELIGKGRHSDARNSDFAEVAIILPTQKSESARKKAKNFINVPGIDFPIPLVRRKRRSDSDRKDITGVDRKFAYVVERIAGGELCTRVDGDLLQQYDPEKDQELEFAHLEEPFEMDPSIASRRGAVLLTLFDDRDEATLNEIDKSGEWIQPSFEKGEVGVALAFNSPHAPLKLRERAIEWSVVVPGKEGEKDPVTVDDPMTVDANRS